MAKREPTKITKKGIIFVLLIVAFIIYVQLSENGKSIDNTASRATSTTKPVKDYWVQKANYFGAFNKENFELYMKLASNNDTQAMHNMIVEGKVFILKGGVKVYVDEHGFGRVKIRPEGQTDSYWVLWESIQ